MDEIDKKIIEELKKNARESFQEIAENIDVSRGTVYNRISKMEKEKTIMGYVPLINPEKLGYSIIALINFKLSRELELETRKKIVNRPQILLAYQLSSGWDAVALGHFKDLKELKKTLKWAKDLKGIDKAEAHLVIDSIKDGESIAPPG